MTVSSPSLSLLIRVGAAWLLTVFVLALAGWVGEIAQAAWGLEHIARLGVQAMVMSLLVVPCLMLLRTRLDRKSLTGIGFSRPKRAWVHFTLGLGIIAIPLVVVLVMSDVFGWAEVTYNRTLPALGMLAAIVATRMLFEALPEELAFRGYIYRNLSDRFTRRLASAMTVALFVLAPPLVVVVSQYVFGMDIDIGGANRITVKYVIVLTLFGAFLQYLRVLTGTLWAGVGFHTMFLIFGRITGPGPGQLIQITDTSNPVALAVTGGVTLVLILLGLFVAPKVTGLSLGWSSRDPEGSETELNTYELQPSGV